MARLFLATAVALLLAVSSARGAVKVKVGDDPPPKLDFHTKLSDYRGKIVIVSFWASWCPPCRKELGVLAAIQQQATRDKLVVFSVNWQENGRRFQELKRFFKDKNLELTLISDEDGYIGRKYGVEAIPFMVIIGRDGKVAAIHVGYGDGEIKQFADEINGLWNAQVPETR